MDDSSAGQEDMEQLDSLSGQPEDNADAAAIAESDETIEEMRTEDENAMPSFPTESSSVTCPSHLSSLRVCVCMLLVRENSAAL